MDNETAKYIVNFYYDLLPRELKLAVYHTRSLLFNKSTSSMFPIAEIYRKFKWINGLQEESDLIQEGEGAFLINVADKIMKEHFDDVFLNYCPKCNGLARTPSAKQCYHCGYDWH